MGQSLSGMLVYGWDLGYDDPPGWAEEFVEAVRESDDYEAWLLEASGFVNPHPDPWDEVADKPQDWFRDPGKGWGNSAEYDQWLADTEDARDLRYAAAAEAEKDLDAELVLYGGEQSGLILSVADANVESYDWGAEIVDLNWIASLPALRSRLVAASDRFGLIPDVEPQLILTASYG